MFIGSWIRFFSSLARIGYSGLRPAVNEITRRRDITRFDFLHRNSFLCVVLVIQYMSFQKIFSLEKKFLFSRKVSSMNRITFVRSFVKNWKGKKKKNYERREIISNPDISVFRHNAFSVGCVACAHKLNAWVDKKFAIVETRPWKERVVNNGYTSMSRQRSGRHCQIGSFGSRF